MKIQLPLLLILFLGVGYFFTPVFQTTDDTEAQLTLSGISASAQPEAALRYSHILLGEVLAGLYRVAPNMPWYGLFLYTVHFLGLLGIVSFFLKQTRNQLVPPNFSRLSGIAGFSRHRNWGNLTKCSLTSWTKAHRTGEPTEVRRYQRLRLLPLWGWILFVEIIFLQQLQFTTAAFIAALGALCVTSFLNKKEILARGALFVLAAMLRWESAVLAVIVLLPVGVLLSEGILNRLKIILLGIFLATLSFIIWQSHIALQSRDAGWRAYYAREATGVRIGMLDYRDQRYAWTPETAPRYAAAAHWSENDHQLFNRWFLADSSVLGVNAIQRIQSAFAGSDGMPLRDRLGRAAYFFSHLPVHLTLNFVLIGLCLLAIPTWRLRGILLASTAWVFFLAFVLAGWRHLPERVSFPLFSVPLLLGYYWGKWDDLNKVLGRLFACLWALPIALSVSFAWESSLQARKSYKNLHALLERLDPQSTMLYFGNPGFLWQPLALPFSPPQDTLLARFHAADAGHLSDTPIFYQRLANQGISDLHRQIAQGNISIICYPNDSLLKYYKIFLKEHYGISIEWECRFGEQGIAVYQAVLN